MLLKVDVGRTPLAEVPRCVNRPHPKGPAQARPSRLHADNARLATLATHVSWNIHWHMLLSSANIHSSLVTICTTEQRS
jgi:hypothetical protein